jgi:hypothetical protein
LSDDLKNHPQNQRGDPNDQSHRIHPDEADDQEEDQHQEKELPDQLEEGIFLLAHQVLTQNSPEPTKIEQGDPPTQDQSQ